MFFVRLPAFIVFSREIGVACLYRVCSAILLVFCYLKKQNFLSGTET